MSVRVDIRRPRAPSLASVTRTMRYFALSVRRPSAVDASFTARIACIIIAATSRTRGRRAVVGRIDCKLTHSLTHSANAVKGSRPGGGGGDGRELGKKVVYDLNEGSTETCIRGPDKKVVFV